MNEHSKHHPSEHASHSGMNHAKHEAHASHSRMDHAKHRAHAHHEEHMASHLGHGVSTAGEAYSPTTEAAVHGESRMGHAGHAAHAGHGDAHAGHSEEMFKRPFWIALVLTIPVVIYADMIQMIFGYQPPSFPGSQWIEPVLASIIYWYSGWVFLSGAVAELRNRLPGMMTLVSLAISTAYFYSLAVTFGTVEGMPFYWELATLVTIMLLGHWLEMRAVGSAQSALQELAKLLPDTAERIVDGRTEQVPVSAL